MQITFESFLAIVGMAAVTIAVKASGLLLAERLPRTGFAAAWLRYIPGAVLASLVAPAILSGRLPEALAAVATAAAFVLTRSLLPAMVAGVAAIYLLRLIPGV